MIEGQGCHLVLVVVVLGRSAGSSVAKMGKGGGEGLTNEPPALMNLKHSAIHPLRTITQLSFIGRSKR